MTKLLYRGHAYEQRSRVEPGLTQLRYDRSHFKSSQTDLRNAQPFTYRGCSYSTEGRQAAMTSNIRFCYRGVAYSH